MTDDRIEGTLKNAGGHVQDAVGGLTGDDKTQAKGKLNEVSGTIQDTVGKVKGQAQEAYGKAKDQASDAIGQAKDKAQDFSGDLEERVRDQPLAAIGVALGVGLVLGMMLRGGRKTVYVPK